MKPRNRKLVESNGPYNTHEPSLATSPALLESINNNATLKNPIGPNAPFDSSTALTVLALLIALFFMGLFSIYIRRFSAAESSSAENISRRRRQNNNSSNSSPTYVGPPRRASSAASNKGVDPSTVRSLPVYVYHGDAKHQTNDCAVCLSQFEEREEVKMIPYCRHVFHPYCIERWLSAHVSCPLCRTTRFFPAKDDKEMEIDREVEVEGRSTVEIGDTWTSGVRRTSSCSSLGERVPSLQRTSSF